MRALAAVMFLFPAIASADAVDDVVDSIKPEIRDLVSQQECNAACREKYREEGRQELRDELCAALGCDAGNVRTGDGPGAERSSGNGDNGGSASLPHIEFALPANIAYEECGGGPVTTRNVVYIDPVNGDDNNPGTQAQPRITPVLEANTANLFKRGTTYSKGKGTATIHPPHTADGIVFGAYGSGPKPVIEKANVVAFKLQGIDNWTIRDLEFQGLDTMDGGNMKLCFNLADNDGFSVRFWRGTHHVLILGNIFDEGGNDALNIHDETHNDGQCFVKDVPGYDSNATCHIGPHWWLIGNTFYGHDQEELVDYESEGENVGDLKIIRNYFWGNGKECGKVGKVLNNSSGVWLIGNTVTVCRDQGFALGHSHNTEYSRNYQVTGNQCDNTVGNRPDRGCFRIWGPIDGDVIIHSNTGKGLITEYNNMPAGPYRSGDPLTLQKLGDTRGWPGPEIVGHVLNEMGITR